jgi:hypothetical protein
LFLRTISLPACKKRKHVFCYQALKERQSNYKGGKKSKKTFGEKELRQRQVHCTAVSEELRTPAIEPSLRFPKNKIQAPQSVALGAILTSTLQPSVIARTVWAL